MSSEHLNRDKMRHMINQWKHPVPEDVVTLSKIKPKIEVNCKKYAMILFEDRTRPMKKATRGRSSRSRSRSQTPTPITFKWLKENLPQDSKNSTATEESTASNGSISKPVKGIRKPTKSDALGPLNLVLGLGTQAKRVRFREEVEVTVIQSRPKRKRAEEVEITAENIPLDAILPALQFGMNKDICPKKKRRLQSLFPAET